MSIMACQTGLIIGCYWLLIALGNDISQYLYAINATKINRLQLKGEFIKFIKLQSDAKQLSEKLQSRIHQQNLFINKYLISSTLLELFQIFWMHMNLTLRHTSFGL